VKAASNVAEFRRLEAAIEASEADVEAMRWRQAELAAEAVAGGMTRTAYAQAVGKDQAHVSRLVNVWTRYGLDLGHGRPRFRDAYATVRIGSSDIVDAAEASRRGRERQVPTRHEDRVEMATTLLADPDVVKGVLAQPARARSEIRQAVHDEAAAEREHARQTRQQQREDRALPLPAYMATMVVKMGEWAAGLAALYDDLDALPDGEGRDAVARAAGELARQAQRWLDRLERRPELRVVEGEARRVRA
jgi:hypothetical protein